MSNSNLSFGDRVRHMTRPEWGIGTVVKVEPLPANGQLSQRLSIRFPNAGVKTLIGGQAELERVTEAAEPFTHDAVSPIKMWDKMNGSDFLGPLAKRKIEEAMITLPPDVKDPFNSLAKRLALMLGLYRFDLSGHALMDWAVAQTGIDDPLTRFTRQELEQHFKRWAFERENYLAKLVQEARMEQAVLAAAVKQAPRAAQDAVRRLTGSR